MNVSSPSIPVLSNQRLQATSRDILQFFNLDSVHSRESQPSLNLRTVPNQNFAKHALFHMPCKMLYRKNTIVLNNRILLRKLNIASGLLQWSMFLKMMVKLVLVVIILSPSILASKYHNTLSHSPKMFFAN